MVQRRKQHSLIRVPVRVRSACVLVLLTTEKKFWAPGAVVGC
jgi:hypothetical protein